MPIKLPSMREEFNGFNEFYASDIIPYLHEQEEGRKLAVKHSALIITGTLSLAIFSVAIGLFGEAKFHVGAGIGVLGFAASAWVVGQARTKITEGLLSRVCTFFGYVYRQKFRRPALANEFDRLGLFGSYNREEWEDEVRGVRHDVDFTLCEAHLKYRSSGKNSSTRTIFHGQVLAVDYHKDFLGETVIKRDAGAFNRLSKPGKGFQSVGIVSPKFEKIFEAWSTDQVEARELLDPIVLERFEELDNIFSGKNLKAAFSKGRLLLVIETGDRLNMGSMYQPLAGPERVEDILKAFDAIFDLIDVLIKRLDGRIDGVVTAESVRGV